MTDLSQMSDADLMALYRRPAPSDVAGMVATEAARQGVDPAFALRVAKQESGFRPDARSPRGAVGPMQLLPDTARQLGVDPTDTEQNVRGGVTYLKQQLDHFGDPALAAAAYNAGPGAVQRHGGVPPYRETQNYVKAVTGPTDISRMSNDELMALYKSAPPAVPGPVRPPQMQPPAQQPTSFRKGFEQGLSQPFANVDGWIKAAMDKAGYEPAPWLANIAKNLQGAQAQAEAQHPATYQAKPSKVGAFVGNMTATAPLMYLPGGALVQGGAMGAANSDKKTVGGVLKDAALGAATGKATEMALGAAGKGVASLLSKPAQTMSPEQLIAAKNAAYDAVDNAGITYKPSAVDGLVTSMSQDLASARLNPLLHPKAAATLDVITQELQGKPASLNDLDELRQYVSQNVMDGTSKGEQRLGRMMIGHIDDFINGTNASHVLSGDPQAGASMIAQARDLNTRVMKTQAIQEAIDKAGLRTGASGSGANIDNATRGEMLRVLKKTGNFTPDEEDALTKLIMGGSAQNILRGLGKMSPLNGGMAGMVNTVAAATNPMTLGAAIPTSAAKLTADQMTQNNAKNLLRLVAAGGSKSALAKVPTPAARAAIAATQAATPAAPGVSVALLHALGVL